MPSSAVLYGAIAGALTVACARADRISRGALASIPGSNLLSTGLDDLEICKTECRFEWRGRQTPEVHREEPGVHAGTMPADSWGSQGPETGQSLLSARQTLRHALGDSRRAWHSLLPNRFPADDGPANSHLANLLRRDRENVVTQQDHVRQLSRRDRAFFLFLKLRKGRT